MKLLQAFRDNPNIIQVVVGGVDENKNLTDAVKTAFHEVSSPRFKAWQKQKVEEEEAAKKKAAMPKLLNVSETDANPMVLAKQKRVKRTKDGGSSTAVFFFCVFFSNKVNSRLTMLLCR